MGQIHIRVDYQTHIFRCKVCTVWIPLRRHRIVLGCSWDGSRWSGLPHGGRPWTPRSSPCAPAPGIGLLQAGYKNQVHIFKIYDHKDYKVKSSTTQLENTFKVIKRLTSLLLVVANTSSLRPFGGLFFNKTSSAWVFMELKKSYLQPLNNSWISSVCCNLIQTLFTACYQASI